MMSNNYKHADMQTFKHFTKNAMAFYAYGFATLLLTGCQSYQNLPEKDGVYAGSTPVVSDEQPNSKNNYYQQYFSTKAAQLEELPEEDLIFTDISAYSSNESIDEEGYVIIEEPEEEAYGGWGNNTTDVTINVYNTGWNDPYYFGGWSRPWGFNNWNRPFWGFNSPWGWSPFWNWSSAYYNPYYFYGPGYWPYNNYYGNQWYQQGYSYANVGHRGRSNQDLLRRQQRPDGQSGRYATGAQSNRSSESSGSRVAPTRYHRSTSQSQTTRTTGVTRRFNPSSRTNTITNNNTVTPRPPQNIKVKKQNKTNAVRQNQTQSAPSTRPQSFSSPSGGTRNSSSGRGGGGRGGRGGQ
jgi:hypothetical protein